MCPHPPNIINSSHTKLELPSKNQFKIDNCEYMDYSTDYDLVIDDSKLNIIQFNIRGLLNKQSELCDLLNNCIGDKINVAILNETWIKKSNLNRIDLPGYNYIGK